MVLTDFSFLREVDDPALMAVESKYVPSPTKNVDINPADDNGSFSETFDVSPEPEPMNSPTQLSSSSSSSDLDVDVSNPSSTSIQHETTLLTQHTLTVSKRRRAPRLKSYSECGPGIERIMEVRARPMSAGDADDFRKVTISGFTKSKDGVWMFKVDVGTDEFNSYAIRRRFSDFRALHEEIHELGVVDPSDIPELPHHGVYSVVQLLFSPETTLAERSKMLEALLKFVNSHPTLSRSDPFIKFIGKNPSSIEVGYVSLSGYDAPTSEGLVRSPHPHRVRCQSN